MPAILNTCGVRKKLNAVVTLFVQPFRSYSTFSRRYQIRIGSYNAHASVRVAAQ